LKKKLSNIYIIDKTRRSLKVEMEGIKKILEKLREVYPEAYERILPV